MKLCHKTYLSLLAVTSAFGFSSSACAAVDYGSLEAIFNEPVTTSATGTPQRASQVTANMDIITADQIRRSGTRFIPQIITKYVAGINLLQGGYAGFDLGVRGYQQPGMPRLLVLVDGRQVFVDDYSRTFWNNIPVNVDDIRQIEVVKGPASALFGSNAAGGVVNIVTYSPKFDQNNVMSAYAGGQRTKGGDATLTRNGDWGGTKFSVGGYNANEFNVSDYPIVDKRDLDPSRRYVTNSSIFNVTPDLEINTEATYAFSRQNGAIAIFTEASDKVETYSARIGAQWKTKYGLLINDNYYNRTYDPLRFGPAVGTGYNFVTNLAVSKLEDQFTIGSKHTFRLGIEFRNKENRTEGQDTLYLNERPELRERDYAASGTWLWQIADNLSWTNAARFDHMDMSETGMLPAGTYFTESDYSHVINTFSANSGLSYQATPKDTFNLSYGRGVQMPSMLESGIGTNLLVPGPALFFVQGNPRLKPTIVNNYELDYNRKIDELYSTAKLSMFYQVNNDIKSFTYLPGTYTINGYFPTSIYSVLNVDGSHAWGGEFEFKGSKDNLRWGASYSLARVVDDPATSATWHYEESSPVHIIKLNGGYTYNNWEFDANGQYSSSTNMPRNTVALAAGTPQKVDGYYILGARIGYNFNERVTFALSGVNINHQYLQENPYPEVERQVLATVTGKF